MLKSKVFINVLSSGAQVFFTSVVYFFLYQLLLTRLDVELLGVWSIVLSTSSIATLANFGIASSVTRFVSELLKDNEKEKIKELIFTSVLSLSIVFLTLSLLVYPFAKWILKEVISIAYLNSALDILPYSLFCLIINAVTGVYFSVLEGMQKNYVKNIVLTFSSLILLALSYVLMDNFGFSGLALAQVVQSLFNLIVAIIFVSKYLPHDFYRWRFSRTFFKEIFKYGSKFQLISFSTLLNDPLTKILLVRYGGLQFAGYYEMANRLVSQFRSIIVNSNQSLIPVIVSIKDNKQRARYLYARTFIIVHLTSLTILASLFFISRSISLIWIGKIEWSFIYVLSILCLGYFFNLISAPAYFSEMSLGKLNLLLKSHVLISLLNVLIGTLLGIFFGGIGVTIGWSLALISNSIYLNKSYQTVSQITNFSGKSILKISTYVFIGCTAISLMIQNQLSFKSKVYLFSEDVFVLVLFLASMMFFLRHDFNYILINKEQLKDE